MKQFQIECYGLLHFFVEIVEIFHDNELYETDGLHDAYDVVSVRRIYVEVARNLLCSLTLLCFQTAAALRFRDQWNPPLDVHFNVELSLASKRCLVGYLALNARPLQQLFV